MTGPSATSLKLALSALKVAPRVYEKVQVWKGKPTKKDRERLRKYARRLDERRVFSARFDVEVVEACVVSVSSVAEFTDEVLGYGHSYIRRPAPSCT